MKKHALLLLAASVVACHSSESHPDWIELDQPVEYTILAFSVDERATLVAEALGTLSTNELLAPLEAERNAAGSGLSVAAFGSARGTCVVGACRDAYFEMVDAKSGDALGLLEVRDVFADTPPVASFVDEAPQKLTLLPTSIPYHELSGWLADQSRALTIALAAQDAEAHAQRLQSEMTESAATLVVRRFVSAGREGECADEGCRDTFVQLQQQEWGQLTPYTISTLRIRSFDDARYEVEVVDDE
jgi:hypothetical protein